jgi:hypothetical protein
VHRTLDLIPASNASRRGCLTTQRGSVGTVQIRVPPLSRWPGVEFNWVHVERARRLVPSVIFLSTDTTQPDFGPASLEAVICLYVLFHLPGGMSSCVAERVTNRSGIEKHGSAWRT